jgi:hypothetical protein
MNFKKIMLVMGSALMLQGPSAHAVSFSEAAFDCVFFVCPAMVARVTGISWIIEQKERREESKKILAATDDALFFKAHVMETQAGEYGLNFYRMMVIRVAPTDILTQMVQVKKTFPNDSSGAYWYESEEAPLVVDQTQPIVLDLAKVAGVKINGRELVSNKLAEAHKAANYLVTSDVLKVESTGITGNPATNALALNEVVIKAAQEK